MLTDEGEDGGSSEGSVRAAGEAAVEESGAPHVHQGVCCASLMCLARVSPPPCNAPFLSACLTRLTCRMWSQHLHTPPGRAKQCIIQDIYLSYIHDKTFLKEVTNNRLWGRRASALGGADLQMQWRPRCPCLILGLIGSRWSVYYRAL